MIFNKNVSIFMNDWEIKEKIKLETFYFEEYDIPGAEEDYTIIKVFIVFSDEIHPSDTVHKIYQAFRKWFFGSEKDISPIYLLTTKQSKEIIKIFFESSEDQNFFELFPDHIKKAHENDIQGLNFYISTWNHLFLLNNPSFKEPKDPDLSKLGEWNKIDIQNGWKKIKSEKIKNKEKFGRRFGSFHEFVMDQLILSELGMEFIGEEGFEEGVYTSTEDIFQIDKIYEQKNQFVNFIRDFMSEEQVELDFKPDQVKILANSIIKQKLDFQRIQRRGVNKFIKKIQKI